METAPLITNDAITLGLLIVVLASIFYTSSLKTPFWRRFYTYVPALLLCYFIPAILRWPLGLVDGDGSELYYVASRYLLPASLILLCLGIDFKGVLNLGPKALIMFFTGTLGIILGGPFALIIITTFFPNLLSVPPDDLWRGFSTVAGSWIGGGANQTAMKEIFDVNDTLFGSMILVDVIVANIWMGFLLYGANITSRIDKWLKADTSAIDQLRKNIEDYQASIQKFPSTTQLFILLAIAFGGVAASHLIADFITPLFMAHEEALSRIGLNSLTSKFFWLIVVATTIGLSISFTRARQVEGYGASNWGSIFIYVLVATIGMKMNLKEIFNNPQLFLVGFLWMAFHAGLLILVAKLIRAPFFFAAVGSQANVGGAASAPVVAAAFSPSLASVGVLLAVLGYALGTYGALITAILMQYVVT